MPAALSCLGFAPQASWARSRAAGGGLWGPRLAWLRLPAHWLGNRMDTKMADCIVNAAGNRRGFSELLAVSPVKGCFEEVDAAELLAAE